MKLSVGGGDAETSPCESEHRDQEDDGHTESSKGSQKLLKHVAGILMVEQGHYGPLG